MASVVDELAVEVLAKALYEGERQAYIAEVSAVPVPLEQIKFVLSDILEESDRSSAILIFSLIDDIFIFYYSHYLNSGVKGGVSSLLNTYGPLSTASARIDMAAALKWIGKPTYEGLQIVRKIRNEFAHKTRVRSFNDDPVRSWIDALAKYEQNVFEFVPDVAVDVLDSRSSFFARMAVLLGMLVSELTTKVHFHKYRRGVARIEFDEMSPDLSNAIREFAKMMILACRKK